MNFVLSQKTASDKSKMRCDNMRKGNGQGCISAMICKFTCYKKQKNLKI